jgi:hypothetical protein
MTTSAPSPTPPTPAAPEVESVILRPWPKIVFLYPTLLCSLVFFLMQALWQTQGEVGSRLLGNTFMLVFACNLMVFAFDFSRIKSITLVALGIALVLLILWADTKWQVTPFLGKLMHHIDIQMNAGFYGFFAAFLAFVFLVVFANSRFNYYEINAREILHHSGYLGDVKRWSTEGLEMNKEIYDLFEFLLLRSGRLIFLPTASREAIVIDNVVQVNAAEERIKDLLSIVAVRMNQRPGPG